MQIAHIAGNIGKEAVIRNTQGGDIFASFSVAVSNGRDKDSTWYDCTLWGKRGEALCQYLTKGAKVTVMGRLSVRVYEGKAYMGINVSEITLQGGKQEQSASPSRHDQQKQNGYQPDNSHELDDEIPF